VTYAIAPTFEANKIGVRRMYTLGMFRGMGDVNDTAQGMINEGYDPNVIYPLVSFGATDAQLQSLWNSYGANTPEFQDAANGLLSYLKSTPNLQPPPANMQTTSTAANVASAAASSVQSAIVDTAFGTYDLTLESSWNAINALFTTVQQQLNSIVQAQGGKPDADTINHISDFNQLVAKWANYYQQAMAVAPSPIPYASWTGLSGTLGVIPVAVVLGIGVTGLVVLLTSLYGIYTWGQVKQSQTKATAQVQTTAVTGAQSSANTILQQANALLAQANSLPASQSAQAAALRAQAASMQQQAGVLLGQTVSATAPQPGATSALTSWFTQNWIGVAAVILGIAVLPGLVKKL